MSDEPRTAAAVAVASLVMLSRIDMAISVGKDLRTNTNGEAHAVIYIASSVWVVGLCLHGCL